MPLFGGRTRHGDGEQAVVGRNAAAIRRATRSVREYWFSSPRFAGKRQDAHAYRALLVMNVLEAALICVSGILVFEMSIKALQQQFSRTVIFPLYLPRAMGIAVAAKHQGSVALGNFIGFYFSRIYMAVRSSNSLGHSRFVAVVLFAILGTCESQIGAWFMKKWLCQQHPRKKEVPTFDNVAQAFSYILIVFSTSLVFETLIAVAECVTSMVEWKYFFRYWGTWWLGVLSAMLSLSPAVIHLMALELPPQPLLHFLLLFSSKKKVMGSIKKLSIKRSFKAVFLWSLTLGLLIMVFLYSVRTFIRPLPYLLFPLIICVAFVFNRVGWSLVVAVSSLFCALGTLHRDSSLYYMAGAPKDKASLSLVLQIELFISVVGLVGIVLAAAVKEKNQLTHDLNQAMEGLEKTVEERTKELVKANEGLQVSQKTAEHASHAKSEFLANMSHEIRTPIHGILGLTTLLLESKLTVDQQESLISLKECADLLLHIINSVLDLTKIEAGHLEVQRVPFSIRRLVSSTLLMLQTRALDRGLKLLWEVQAEVPDLLVGDTGKIQQCLLNLVGNALKFTNKGTVTVRVMLPITKDKPAATKSTTVASFGGADLGLQEADNSALLPGFSFQPVKQPPTSFAKLHSWSSWPGAYFKVQPDNREAYIHDDSVDVWFGSSKVAPVTEIEKPEEESPSSNESTVSKKPVQIEFEVQDTGIGITKDKLQDMFNPFTQADPSASRLYGGTGLGLSIVQRFVELLGGTIWANSVVDKGSTFTFKLPFVAFSGDKDDDTSAAAAAVVASSDHVIQHPLRFPSLEKNWPTPSKTTTAAKSGLLSHRRAYSLGVLLRGVKFSLPDASSYNAEFLNGEDSSDLGASKQWAPGGNGVTSSPVDQSVRASVSGAIQGENGLFQQNVLLSDQDLLHSSKEDGISSDRGGSRPPVGMDSRQHDSSCQPSSAMAAESSKLVKNPELEQCARNPSGHESLGTLLPNSSCSHNLSRAAEIPQKPTDVFILEKLRSLTTLSSTSQELQATNSLSPSLENQDGVSPQCLEISMHDNKDVVIDVPEVNYGRFLQGSDQCHPKGVASSGSLNLTVGLSTTDSASHKLGPNGANLGHSLSLPEGIVQTSQDALQIQHHQKVVLESQKRFPKKAAAMVASPPKDAPEQRLKILLAEDNPINQKVATRQLEKYGHRVTIVSDGREALETVQVHHDMFDVVLMDVQMPNMDGLQATQHIREVEQQEGWSRLPILGLTAHVIHGYQETCLSHGMDGYLGKPFNIKQLLVQMIEILPLDKKLLRDEGEKKEPSFFASSSNELKVC